MSTTAIPTTTDRWSTVLDGTRLKDSRRQHRMSRAELGRIAGISPSTVAKLERQPHAPCRCRTLFRLAIALGMKPANLACRPDGGQQATTGGAPDTQPPASALTRGEA